ncbi:MAG: hypothetical protein ACFE7E_08425 [Candidatus Hodarchaeota archaeon]
MIAEYNRMSFCFGIPGIILQIAGQFVLGPLATLLGTVLLLVGIAYYAKAIGRSPAWCLLAFFSIIGLIILGFLEDKAIRR